MSKNTWTIFNNIKQHILLLGTMLLVGIGAQAQVTGVVTDAENGEPLIGVNILVVGGDAMGTITDFDGSYSVNAEQGDTLAFSYVGYNSQKVAVTALTTINVQLAPAGELLEEVVVIGYGSVGKKDLTGVVSKVDEKKFNLGVNSSPENLLTGKVAGVQISNNGEPGGANRIRIRGGTSLNASNDPLIVIDGVPLPGGSGSGRNPLNFVNAADVESISVLKDASAAAIYGSRGANGVIIITTKSGRAGRLRVNYTGNAGISVLGASGSTLSPNNFRNAILAKEPSFFERLGDANTDWVDEVTRDAISTEHNLSVSGGNEKMNYFLSGGYLLNEGIIRRTSNEATSIAGNFSTKLLNDNLSVTVRTRTGFVNDRFIPDVINTALGFDPTQDPYDPENEEFGGYFQWENQLAANNPVSTVELTDETGESIRSINSLTLDYQLPFLEGLSIKSNTSYDIDDGSQYLLRPPTLKEHSLNVGSLEEVDIQRTSLLQETFGTYTKNFEPINSKLVFTAGHSWQNFDNEDRRIIYSQLEQEGGDWMATNVLDRDSTLEESRLISFFGRANFTLQEKYLITASLRRDGSSKFGEANRWGWFPSVAVGWRILEEPFANNWDNTFSNLKLRFSWGITGNESIGNYRFSTFYRFGSNDATYQFGDEFVNTLRARGVDPDIKWEETSSYNLGVDFGFFNNRLSGALELYYKYTDDLLAEVPVAAFTNLSDIVLTNIGEMENQGVELELNGVVLDREDWGWDLSFNVAYNENTIEKLDNSDDQGTFIDNGGISGDVGQTIQVWQVGYSNETFKTYEHLMAGGSPLNDTQDHNGDGVTGLSDIYRDINNDGIINEEDLVNGFNALPDYMFGLTSNLRYKNFDMAATFRANVGNYVYNNVASSLGFFDRLRGDFGEFNNIHESAFVNDFQNRQLKSDVYIEDASFLRLDNITIGYNFTPNKIFNSLRVFTTAQNLFVLTNYSGIDPELPQAKGGIDNNVYPIARRFMLGVNAQF